MKWEIVCADGQVRHYPYHNVEDAEEDAALAAKDCGLGYEEPSFPQLSLPPCPGGVHTVRPLMSHMTPRGEA
jgi:hypothetical protein